MTTQHILSHFLTRCALQLRDTIQKLVLENPSEPVEVLSWLSRTTLDVIGLAGIFYTYHVSPMNRRINCAPGFDYHFDALSVDEEPNELSLAFATLFHSNRSIAFLDILQAYFPILQHLVRILLQLCPLLSAE